jgi:FkbM family methyltransferase
MMMMSLLNTVKFITTHPLNKGQQLNALIRFLKWQLSSKIFPSPIIYRWINGSLIIYPGDTGLTGNLYCGLHEFADMAYLLHVTTAESLLIDIGANVGSYTVLACAVRGARGYCFEPVPLTYERLIDNIKINNLSERVIALNLGLSDREDELVFTADENCMNHVVTSDSNDLTTNTVKVKVLPLDKILQSESPSLIKIDVEGFERLVLKGMETTLANESLHSVIMELNGSGSRYGFKEEEILRTMIDYGFLTYTYEPFSRKLKTLDGKNNLSGNTLFIRNENLVKERIEKSTRILIGNMEI